MWHVSPRGPKQNLLSSPLNLCSCSVHLNYYNLRPTTNPSPSSCSMSVCVCVCVCGNALSVTSGAFFFTVQFSSHDQRGMCVCFFFRAYVCCCRAIIGEGLARTPMCVLIQRRGRVSGVKGSVGEGEMVVSGWLEAGEGGEVWSTCLKVDRLS